MNYDIKNKVLIMGNNSVDDGQYTIIEHGYKDNSLLVEDSKKDRYWVFPDCCDVFQSLLSCKFDATIIPKEKIEGYKVWVEVSDIDPGSWIRAVKGWHSIKTATRDDIIFVDNAAYKFDGKYEGKPEYAQLYFQQPEKCIFNENPSDALLLKTIIDYPWLPGWCKDGICEDGAKFSNCPCSGAENCTGENSVCFKILGTHIDFKGKGANDCPCFSTKVNIKEVKNRIVKLDEKTKREAQDKIKMQIKKEIDIDDTILTIGNYDVKDGIYKIVDKDSSSPPFKLNYKAGWWIDPEESDVFQKLLSGQFDANKIPKDKITNYRVWDAFYKEWRKIKSFRNINGRITVEFNDKKGRCFFPIHGTWFGTQQLYFQPPKEEHMYKIGDCFECSEKRINRLSKGSVNNLGVLVDLGSNNEFWSGDYALNDDNIIIDQNTFKDFLVNFDLTYIGTSDEIVFNFKNPKGEN